MKPKTEAEGGGLEHDTNVVFARTFAEPVAPTRFFAAALMLEREQLIALHIHEALHRALPPDLRENESTVSQLTLALAALDSTHDRVQATVARVLYANRFAGRAVAQEALAAAAPAAQTKVSIRDFLGIGEWELKYKQAEIATWFSNHDEEDAYGVEFMHEFKFNELGPLGRTSIEPYLAMAFDNFGLQQIANAGFSNGLAGAKLSTRIWGDDRGDAFFDYRYVTSTPADAAVRASYDARTIKDYALRYRSRELNSYHSNFSISIIDGSGSDMAYLADYVYPGQILGVTFGSIPTAKYLLDIQLTGDAGAKRGLVFQPSAELVEIEPTTTRAAVRFQSPDES